MIIIPHIIITNLKITTIFLEVGVEQIDILLAMRQIVQAVTGEITIPVNPPTPNLGITHPHSTTPPIKELEGTDTVPLTATPH